MGLESSTQKKKLFREKIEFEKGVIAYQGYKKFLSLRKKDWIGHFSDKHKEIC